MDRGDWESLGGVEKALCGRSGNSVLILLYRKTSDNITDMELIIIERYKSSPLLLGLRMSLYGTSRA